MIAPTPFFADRGCHVRILEEARSLETLGHHVTICTYHIGRDIDGIEIKRSLRIPWYSKLSAGPSLHKLYIDVFLLWTVVLSCLKKKPDIIHGHIHEGIVIGKIVSALFRVPLVADLQGSLTEELLQYQFMKEGRFLHRFIQWAERMINRLPDAIFVSSGMSLDSSPDKYREVKCTLSVIPDGVNCEVFNPVCSIDGLYERLDISSETKVVGFIGALANHQGLSILLEAIPYVVDVYKNVHFLIMGYPNIEFYKEQSIDLGIDKYITFTGRILYEEVPQYLRICDVGVTPKLSITEANGKLLNYMAMELPVVASDILVNRDILGDIGVYAEVGNPLSLANAILKVLLDDEYRSNIGITLREIAISKYSWTSIGKRMEEVYQILLEDNFQGHNIKESI